MRLPRIALEAGQAAPWYMGLAWYDYYRDQAIVLPVPLNVVAGLARRAYLLLRIEFGSKGMTKGERACFERGVKHGEWAERVAQEGRETR